MVFAIAKRLRRGNNDALARMYAKRVEVLHVADGDAVVVAVAYHFVFNLFPTFKAFLYQHLRRERECFLGQFVQLFLVVAKATTQSAKGISGAQDNGIAKACSGATCLLDVGAGLALDGLDVNLVQFLNKQLAVFGVHDGLHGRTQHFNAILFEYAALVKLYAAVKRCLSAKGQENPVGAFFLDNPFNEIRLNGQEIYLVGYAF